MTEIATKTAYEQGDTVIAVSRYSGYEKFVVEKVTKTQAVLNNGTRLRINEIGGGSEIGDTSRWGRTMYYLSTPKLEAACDKDMQTKYILSAMAGFEHKGLPSELIREFYEFFKEKMPPSK